MLVFAAGYCASNAVTDIIAGNMFVGLVNLGLVSINLIVAYWVS